MAIVNPPVVRAQMLIRRPAAEVYEAFVDPEITTQFWFTRGSARLEAGRVVRWDWDMYGVGALVTVKEIDPEQRILIEWDDPPCPVEWRFATIAEGTLVTISTRGFQGDDDAVLAQAVDSMGGFTLVLAGLKALLEHGVRLNLIADHHPPVPEAGTTPRAPTG